MIAEEVKGRDPKITWEIVGIYRAPNKDMWLLEKLADQTGYMGRTTKCSIIGSDLNFMRTGMVTRKSLGGPRYF